MKFFLRLQMRYYAQYSAKSAAERRRKRGLFWLVVLYILYAFLLILLWATGKSNGTELLISLVLTLLCPSSGYFLLYLDDELYRARNIWSAMQKDASPIPEHALARFHFSGLFIWLDGMIIIATFLLR